MDQVTSTAPPPPDLAIEAPAATRITITGFTCASAEALHERFVALGVRIQLQTPGRLATSPETIRARLRKGFAFYAYGEAEHFIATRDGVDVGRCSAIVNSRAVENGRQLGYVGMWECEDDEAVAHALLETATSWLRAHGCADIVGPVDFSTWYPYRHTIGPFDGAPILLEPYTPPHYDTHWRSFGFDVEQTYFSAAVRGTESVRKLVDYGEGKLEHAIASGYRVELLHRKQFDEALDWLYDLSIAQFAGNPHFTPIDRVEFYGLYAGAKASVDPRLVFFIRSPEGRLAGFLFCIPNFVESARALGPEPRLSDKLRALNAKRRADSVLLKTLVVDDRYRNHGLGTVLMAVAHQAALDLGYSQVHHVLMHETNHSRRISDNAGAETMRRYALYRLPA